MKEMKKLKLNVSPNTKSPSLKYEHNLEQNKIFVSQQSINLLKGNSNKSQSVNLLIIEP